MEEEDEWKRGWEIQQRQTYSLLVFEQAVGFYRRRRRRCFGVAGEFSAISPRIVWFVVDYDIWVSSPSYCFTRYLTRVTG